MSATDARPAPETFSARERIEAALRREQLRSQRLGFRVMLVVLPVIVGWVTIENGFANALAFYPLMTILGLALAGPYLLRRAGRFAPWQDYVFALTYVGLVMALVLVRPQSEVQFPLPVLLAFGNEVYLFLIVAASVFTFSPRVILWTGVTSAVAWSILTLWVLMLPGTTSDLPTQELASLSTDERIRLLSDPHRVYIGKTLRLVVTLLAASGVLAAFVRLVRNLVFRQAEVERERANLSRYFSQNMVDELANSDEPLGPTRSQDVAVLFVDMVGFTKWSAEHTPAAVIEMLREFHARMEATVFRYAGTVDKYIGDAVMATFGTPRTGGSDAGNALRCVRAMVSSVAEWNVDRQANGLDEIRIGVGAHYGPVVLGDIGGAQRLEFAVLGDTVNVASRLERLTRRLGAVAIVSDDLVQAASREGTDTAETLCGFSSPAPRSVSGRSQPVVAWTLERSAGA